MIIPQNANAALCVHVISIIELWEASKNAINSLLTDAHLDLSKRLVSNSSLNDNSTYAATGKDAEYIAWSKLWVYMLGLIVQSALKTKAIKQV